MEPILKNHLVRYFTSSGKKDEETAHQLINLYGPFIEKILWEKGNESYYFFEDILKAHNEGVSPEDWFERSKVMEHTMQNPLPHHDFTRLKELLTDFGVGFKVEKKTPTETFAIVLTTRHEKVSGYGAFRSEYLFDANGNFIEVGIWE